MKTEKTSVRDNINLDEMFNFESTTDEDSLLSATISSNNEEGSGGQRNTHYTDSVIPGFLILL